ncbi:murein L,D-transpeptidase catalytic domain family protein [Pontibacter beigongshangensis]|uniref:murein L,D-transpeptidase catalytic domain family protein n=1 Tax=Pontibacter beigongshangensis TaxID=2574733 RepID=UPI00164F7F49|nr:murein L,D-transpeptidase catalytic domain family protein [Pontibacter beigongshangensis]
MAKKLIPLFAPLILSPVAIPAGQTVAKPDSRRIKSKLMTYKVMKFDQIAYSLYDEMQLQEEGLRFEVFSKALAGYYNLKHDGKLSEKGIITMVDFTKSSREKRLWVIDVHKKDLLFNTYVSHGRNSGEEFAESFSNKYGSYMSSIGFYVTEGTYYGKHGLSLKLNGMDENFNTNALDRCIVMHGAEYASEAFIEQSGRLGRSLGCPALPMEEHEDIINTVVGNTTLYVHASDDSYTSHYLDHANALAEMVQEHKLELPDDQERLHNRPEEGLASI